MLKSRGWVKGFLNNKMLDWYPKAFLIDWLTTIFQKCHIDFLSGVKQLLNPINIIQIFLYNQVCLCINASS